MKTKKTKKSETPPPGLTAAHAALVAVLDQFNLSLVKFLRQPTFCYEHRLVARSLNDLTRLYCLLTQPGLCMKEAAQQCPVWPSGRFAGQRPDSSTLCRIKKRLLPRPPSSELPLSRKTPDEILEQFYGENPFKK